ncbi:TBC1 domain family member 14 like [Heracleum sosnowskyi]|uniref:TBC1 domain family member 14 like n=1 Tax=Heracleum sosnowskyi TaxID=360622 RepID=A0AAD8I479_9APIA|nr:TBC1 domain family member 14 like [Heracleum sosnowskyi]
MDSNRSSEIPCPSQISPTDRSSYVPPNHLSAEEARSIVGTTGPVLLLTIPPSVGYQRSPVTLYYCYDRQESSSNILKNCIAEVSNTPWGEQVRFVFNPNSDLVAKCLHVSPFMDMLGDWKMKTRSIGNNLSVTVSVKHPVLGNYFTAFLTAKRVLSTSKVCYAFFFWFMPQKAAIYTYWQSLKLLLNNVQFFEHPKYQNPGYIEECLTNAKGRGCCMAFPRNSLNSPQAQGRERWYSWKPIKWPWA